MARSFLVVTSLMAKGWMMGTRRHVGIGSHRDGSHIVGLQGLGHQDGGGAVGGADDADGGGVLQIKAQK